MFVQISDENVHLVRVLLDEVFGAENQVATIAVRKAAPETRTIRNHFNYLLWYARDEETVLCNKLFRARDPREGSTEDPAKLALWARFATGEERPLTRDEKRAPESLPPDTRIFRMDQLNYKGSLEGHQFGVEFEGETVFPKSGYSWRPAREEMDRLILARRVGRTKEGLGYRFFLDDYPLVEWGNFWHDTSGKIVDMTYVVQTNTKVIERCMLLSTRPGDLVLDPTSGSGTTAFVAEQWGRRWIAIDTSRVAVTLSRQRMLGARYPYYEIAVGEEGNSGAVPDLRLGFNCRRVPHVTLKSIATNSHIRPGLPIDELDRVIREGAETEILLDQPMVNQGVVRVAGPFTVESLAPHRAAAYVNEATESEAAAAVHPGQTSFEEILLENLRESGVQSGRKDRRLTFDSVKPMAGRYLLAEMVPVETGPVRERVAVTIGPRYGVVGADWIKGAAREAAKGAGFDVLLVLAFAFDPHALEAVQEVHDDSDGFAVQGEREIGALRVLLVRMNADLAMGEKLLKKSKNANLFTVFGEPDVEARHTKEGWVVEVKGFDIYNPVTGEVESGDADDIAMWMLDTDYDEQSFFVRHAYFPGRQDPYTKLKKALKADIDEAAWDTLNSTVSRHFPSPSTGKVAVKVINDYGDEVIRVLKLTDTVL